MATAVQWVGVDVMWGAWLVQLFITVVGGAEKLCKKTIK